MTTWHRQPTGDALNIEPKSRSGTVVWVAADHLTPKEALADPNFPIVRNAYHPDYGDTSPLRCRDIRINATGFRVMTVSAEFGIPDSGSYEEDPSLTKPRVFNWQAVQESVAVDRDINGNAILTSARRSLDGIQKTKNAKRLTITNWESSYAAGTALDWENSVNADAFEGASPQEVRLESIQPSTSYDINATLLPIDYVFLFKPAAIWGDFPHQTWLVDKDSYAYATVDGTVTKVRLCDKTGVQLTDVLLDGTGRPKDTTGVTYLNKFGRPEASPSWNAKGTPTGATAVDVGLASFLRYNTLPARDFADLGLT